jgi:hypothetical protein
MNSIAASECVDCVYCHNVHVIVMEACPPHCLWLLGTCDVLSVVPTPSSDSIWQGESHETSAFAKDVALLQLRVTDLSSIVLCCLD